MDNLSQHKHGLASIGIGQACNERRTLTRVLADNVVASTVIALVLWLIVPAIGRYGFWNTFVHSQAIGNSITLLLVGWFRLTQGTRLDRVPVRIAAVAVLSIVGVLFGLWFASALMGHPETPGQILRDHDILLPSLIAAVLTASLLTGFWLLREEQARLRLAAANQGRRAESAKLAMLRAQIEPHMLFNTLANLRALIQIDPPKALEMLDRLDVFLRATLDRSREESSTLGDEFAMLDNYLGIMKLRLGERLSFALDLPETLASLPVPALLLQPVVENAIRHGVEPAVEGGHIEVRACATSSGVVITVTDTGVGMGAVERRNATGGFGLAALGERLAATHAQACFEIRSPLPDSERGTIVDIFLPGPTNASY